MWSWLVSKRGLNTAALMVGPDVIVSHSEENVDSTAMGMLAALPANLKGTLTDKDARWIVRDVQAGYASPVSDGERIYVVDNGGVLFAFDVEGPARSRGARTSARFRSPRRCSPTASCTSARRTASSTS